MKYFFGFLACIALVVIVFFLVFRGLGNRNDTGVKDVPAMTSYADTQTIVQLTVDGPITANQTHNAYQIVVGRDEMSIETYQGYDRTVLAMKSYANNSTAYEQFLGALDRAGFTRGIESNVKPIGVCATGNTAQLDIVRGTHEVQHYWSTTCKEKGTFRGNLPAVARLFKAQIPDFQQLTNGLDM